MIRYNFYADIEKIEGLPVNTSKGYILQWNRGLQSGRLEIPITRKNEPIILKKTIKLEGNKRFTLSTEEKYEKELHITISPNNEVQIIAGFTINLDDAFQADPFTGISKRITSGNIEMWIKLRCIIQTDCVNFTESGGGESQEPTETLIQTIPDDVSCASLEGWLQKQMAIQNIHFQKYMAQREEEYIKKINEISEKLAKLENKSVRRRHSKSSLTAESSDMSSDDVNLLSNVNLTNYEIPSSSSERDSTSTYAPRDTDSPDLMPLNSENAESESSETALVFKQLESVKTYTDEVVRLYENELRKYQGLYPEEVLEPLITICEDVMKCSASDIMLGKGEEIMRQLYDLLLSNKNVTNQGLICRLILIFSRIEQLPRSHFRENDRKQNEDQLDELNEILGCGTALGETFRKQFSVVVGANDDSDDEKIDPLHKDDSNDTYVEDNKIEFPNMHKTVSNESIDDIDESKSKSDETFPIPKPKTIRPAQKVWERLNKPRNCESHRTSKTEDSNFSFSPSINRPNTPTSNLSVWERLSAKTKDKTEIIEKKSIVARSIQLKTKHEEKYRRRRRSSKKFQNQVQEDPKSTLNIICRICEEPVPLARLKEHSDICATTTTCETICSQCDDRLKALESSITTSIDSSLEENQLQRLCSLKDLSKCLYSLEHNNPSSIQECHHVLNNLSTKLKTIIDESYCEIVNNLIDIGRTKLNALQSCKNSEKRQNKKKRGVSISDFEILCAISRGAYGRVFLGRKLKTNDLYAIKVLRKSEVQSKKMAEKVLKERDILAICDYPHIVRFYYSFESAKNLFLVTEYLPGGDCFSLLQNKEVLDEDLARRFVAETVLAVEFLHGLHIVHRDLKPDNMLITRDGHIKLTDFGLSDVGVRAQLHPVIDPYDVVKPGDELSRLPPRSPNFRSRRESMFAASSIVCGTPDYLAPELLLSQPHSYPVDWWAIGIILYEFLCGVPPFNDSTPAKIFQNIIACDVEYPSDMSDLAVDLITSFLKIDPKERLGTGDDGRKFIKEHKFWKDLDWCRLLDTPSPYVPEVHTPRDITNFAPRMPIYPMAPKDMIIDDEASPNSASKYKSTEFPAFNMVNAIQLAELNVDAYQELLSSGCKPSTPECPPISPKGTRKHASSLPNSPKPKITSSSRSNTPVPQLQVAPKARKNLFNQMSKPMITVSKLSPRSKSPSVQNKRNSAPVSPESAPPSPSALQTRIGANKNTSLLESCFRNNINKEGGSRTSSATPTDGLTPRTMSPRSRGSSTISTPCSSPRNI